MKILFLYKGRYHVRDAVTIEYLSALAKKYGHETDLVYDQDIFGITDNVISSPLLSRLFSSDNRTLKSIVRKKFRIIVFLDGFHRSRWNRQMAEKIKKINSGARTVAIFPWRADPAAAYDYILIGESEVSFKGFLAKQIFTGPGGVYTFKGLADLNSLPLADKELFSPYVNFRDSYPIYTSKGCPYFCSYCEETIYKDRLGEGYFRRRNPENVISELEEAKKKFTPREIIYKDSVFARDKAWLKPYLGIYKKKIDLPYKCFGKAEIFDRELALMLKGSGCYSIEFGAQTFNEHLKADILKRSESTGTLLRAFSICDEQGIRYDVDHMFGVPGERLADHIAAAKLYLELKYINRIKCHNLTFYRQAKIYEHAPGTVKNNEDYNADFFSAPAGEREMLKTNKIFQKYYKVLPLLPRKLNLFILKGKRWKIFNYVPYVLIVFLMLLLALRNQDKRFKVYLKYYPRKLRRALGGKMRGE
jgi:radical SAM superfamily enzyme YgiQ (UPF0313 family)